MNVALAQNLSIYQLALGMQPPPQPLPLSPATLLSLIRAQIDLLIEQQILATLWVKSPPGKNLGFGNSTLPSTNWCIWEGIQLPGRGRS